MRPVAALIATLLVAFALFIAYQWTWQRESDVIMGRVLPPIAPEPIAPAGVDGGAAPNGEIDVLSTARKQDDVYSPPGAAEAAP